MTKRDFFVPASEVKVSTRPIQGGCGWNGGDTLGDAIRKQVAWAMSGIIETEMDAPSADVETHAVIHALHRLLAMSLEVDELAYNAARDEAVINKMKKVG